MDAGIVAIVLGLLVIIARLPLLLFPATTLNWFRAMLRSEAQIRVLGCVLLPLAIAMILAGLPQSTGLEIVLFILGVLYLMIAVPATLIFPRAYMSFIATFIPEELSGVLFGWRLLGLIGTAFGGAILAFGIDAV